MKKLDFIGVLVLLIFLNACNTKRQTTDNPDFPPLEDLFFERKPPGLIPEKIALKFVATGEVFVSNVIFSPDMKEIYVNKHEGDFKESKTLVIRYENNKWQDGVVSNIFRPDNFSKDGTLIYKGNEYMERTESGWSELKPMGAPFDDKLIMGISITDQKTIFFSHFSRSNVPDRDGAISYSQFIDGKYQPSQKLGKGINNGKPLAHPYVAPDESYLLWDAVREEGYGDSDLYISFKQKDGSWGSVMNLGPHINTEQSDSSPSVTPDGKYLTFFRGGYTVNEDGSFYVFGSPYWVSTQVIENLRLEQSTADKSLIKKHRYLGQKPPGLIPEPFAPDFVTTGGWEYGGVFSPDLKEFYFLRQVGETNKEQEFVVFKNENNTWNETVISSRKGQPFISPDGKTMHLGRRYMKRKESGEWSEIKKLDTPFDSLPIMSLTASSKGTYFFDEFKRDFTGDIRYSRLIDGKHEEPKLLNEKINTGKSFHPFIAPDESYLIFDSKREGGYGDSDLYISFRQQNGEWGDPINLGADINTKAWEASASVTPDGKYLFFNRNIGSDNYENVDIFWVSTQVIEKLRPKQ